MNPHHAMHRELALDRNAALLREARVAHLEESALETQAALSLAESCSAAARLVLSWLERRRPPAYRPAPRSAA